MMNYAEARKNMVKGQLVPSQLTCHKLKQAFSEVPREQFVAPEQKEGAYADTSVPLNANRELFAPLLLARILQALDLQETDNVLVVAGNTGYSCAIMANMVKSVTMIEEDKSLQDVAKRAFVDCGNNLNISNNKLEEGCKAKAPYDKIFVDAGAEEIPPALFKQLKDGGKLGAVIKSADSVMEATIFTKENGEINAKCLLETKCRILEKLKKEQKFAL